MGMGGYGRGDGRLQMGRQRLLLLSNTDAILMSEVVDEERVLALAKVKP